MNNTLIPASLKGEIAAWADNASNHFDLQIERLISRLDRVEGAVIEIKPVGACRVLRSAGTGSNGIATLPLRQGYSYIVERIVLVSDNALTDVQVYAGNIAPANLLTRLSSTGDTLVVERLEMYLPRHVSELIVDTNSAGGLFKMQAREYDET
jgi:hypothetical protein